jgi:hypothetical protein
MVCQEDSFCSAGVHTGGNAPKRRSPWPRAQSKPLTPSAAKGLGFFARPAPKGAPAGERYLETTLKAVILVPPTPLLA